MTNEEKIAMYECNIEGFIKEFRSNNHRNLEDAFGNAMVYFLKYGLDEESTTCDLEELIYVFRNEVAKYIAKYQLESNPDNLLDLHAGDNNAVFQQFFKDPVEFLRISIESMDKIAANPNEKDPDIIKYTNDYNKNIDNLVSLLKNPETKRDFETYERGKNNAYFVVEALDDYFSHGEDKNGINDTFNKQKAGFFENLFGTTSNEYKNFKHAFDNYRNVDHQAHGDSSLLEAAAMRYLRHKFPNLKDDELPTMEQISKLSGAGKERASFCLKTIETIHIQEQANKMIDAVNEIDKKLPTNEEIENFKNQVNINEEYKDPLIVENINEEYKDAIENINEEYVNPLIVEDINKEYKDQLKVVDDVNLEFVPKSEVNINADFHEQLKKDSGDVNEVENDLDDDAPDLNKVEIESEKENKI